MNGTLLSLILLAIVFCSGCSQYEQNYLASFTPVLFGMKEAKESAPSKPAKKPWEGTSRQPASPHEKPQLNEDSGLSGSVRNTNCSKPEGSKSPQSAYLSVKGLKLMADNKEWTEVKIKPTTLNLLSLSTGVSSLLNQSDLPKGDYVKVVLEVGSLSATDAAGRYLEVEIPNSPKREIELSLTRPIKIGKDATIEKSIILYFCIHQNLSVDEARRVRLEAKFENVVNLSL